jgi:hypothetical protein
VPGPPIGALYVATNNDTSPSLGRPLSGGVPNVTVNIVEAGKYFGDAANLFDMRLGKVFRFGARRINVNLDIHNLFNASPVLLFNNNYASWLTPQSIMEARLFKLSTNIEF